MIGILLEFGHTKFFVDSVTCVLLQELHKEFGGEKNDALQFQDVLRTNLCVNFSMNKFKCSREME